MPDDAISVDTLSYHMNLRRWTPLTFLAPDRYVDRDDWWRTFDFDAWSRSVYEWTADAWNGFRDFAQQPRACVETGRGDCEDYALVALASAVARERPAVGIAFCWELPYPWPTHVIAFDDDFVYSSGDIVETSVDEWVRASRYSFAVRRRLRSAV
ncbi:hypothetical protein ATH50_1442 [Haloplanus aerogenes]|uniref:Transglutaminase superfamily protein n=2 Tax=Haloplanus aerogenes TaxID=660522 RepID=A0A3M0DRE6_9EURY|nr:hypothetical protein ATH50_1442 [Haloplanus aerogenes]